MQLALHCKGVHAVPAEAALHVPSSWQLLAKAALVFGSTRNTPEVMQARRALLQRCLADALERAPALLLQPELLRFLGLTHSDLPEAFVAWAEQLQASGGAALVATRQACVASAAARTQAGVAVPMPALTMTA